MKSSAIAIVGMAGRFPGARNIDEFWRNLRDGVETVRALSDAEILSAGVAADEFTRPGYVKAAAVLDDVDMFDASFFGFSPKDAAIMDPQHRHFLECAWEALEDAGHVPERFSGSIGVFAGSGMNAYMIHNLLNNRRLLDSAGLFLIRQTGNDKDVLATRVSYQLDLRGPSLSVQTACSTSLVAVHLACQSLLDCECDMALAGGVTIEIPHGRGYIYREGEILSRDGHCRAFDATSSGTVFASGVGLVVLRRLEDALEDHDTIHAVILGSAINNDGQRKVGYLAPSVAGQAEVIAEALEVAGVSADSISYVETHGTGTTVGDPIEIKGLTQAFRGYTKRNGYCAIGSLKTNVGHLDTAAGVAGLIKTVLALRQQKLPASLHFQTANPQIDFPNTPFYVNTALADWQTEEGSPRRAGVTSLGIGGTNAHVVLEEAPATTWPVATRTWQLIPLSARTPSALDNVASRLATHLDEHNDLRLADVAFTAQVGRKAFPQRRIAVARDTAVAAQILAAPETRRAFTGAAGSAPNVVFMFSGQGSQYVNMAADVYANAPVFREYLDLCAEQLRPHLGLDLREILYPSPENAQAAAEQLNATAITQPALFALEYSLAQWWMSLGVRPQAMVGHSIGEYVAACLAEVFSLEDALAVTAARGRLMQQCQPGAMLAVSLSAEDVDLSGEISLAAVNAPKQCVLSGPIDAISRIQEQLARDGAICHRLQTSHAFHSSMIAPALAPFVARLREIKLSQPRIPYVSNLTGKWITPAEATDPEYWGRHLRGTVRFSDCLAELMCESDRVLLEVGPGQVLASLARQQPGGQRPALWSLPRREEAGAEMSVLLGALGQLWIAGQTVDWPALHAAAPAARISLPTYPFERQRYWIDPDTATAPRAGQPISQPLIAESHTAEQAPAPSNPAQRNIDGWFYRRHWSRSSHPTVASLEPACWMVLLDPVGLGRQITIQLRGAGHDVIEVTPGTGFKRLGSSDYTIRPGAPEDYRALFADLTHHKRMPHRIAHLWSVGHGTADRPLADRLDQSFYGLLFLAQALVEHDTPEIALAVITDRVHSVAGEVTVDPVCATVLGPTKVIPKEFPAIVCRNIDVDLTSTATGTLAVQIITEHSAAFSGSVVALRDGERWTESLELTKFDASSNRPGFRQQGVYLITGGLGDLGLVIAEELARSHKAKLVLLGRTPLPPAAERQNALDAADTPERIKQEIRKLRSIESLGAEVLAIACDVTRRDEVQQAIKAATARFGPINGVIHAAGVVDDGPIQLKSRQAAARVLAPKVQGTLVLSEVLDQLAGDPRQREALDFLALFSSVSSVLAPAGQVDYVAANAFLDAFATSWQRARVVAINWGPWRDVGMAARTRSSHPLLARRLVNNADEVAHVVPLDYERNWVLAEHRLSAGRAVLPGTSYLEMACAALVQGSFDRGVEFQDVFFVAPFFAEPGETREAHIHLHRGAGGSFQFSVRARDVGWTEYASGQIARCQRPAPADGNLAAVAARCRSRTISFDDARRTEQERYFTFGPRWRNLQAIHLGEDEALADVELSRPFVDDTSAYHLHPALLDLATGSALYLIQDYEQSRAMYFPLSYKRAIFYRPLPAKFHSHIRQRRANLAGRDLASFDVTLLDEQGRVLGEIEDFAMRLVRDPQQALAEAPARASSPAVQHHAVDAGGIPPIDGARAFMRIMSSDAPAGIVVLPDGLSSATASAGPAAKPLARIAMAGDDVESVLAGWWQELLGVEHLSIDDDFFELGGHSLIVVRLFSEIKKAYGVTFPLSTLFEARTIRKLAALIREAGSQPESVARSGPTLVAIQPKGTRVPLYVISGLGGNVIKFHTMAFHLGEDQPVYGLLPRGLDGREPYHTRVEDMAAYYVAAIEQAQPQGPYHLVGYSFGGAVAWEVAQQLLARGREVGLLGMFDTIEWTYMERVARQVRSRNGLMGAGASNTAEASGEDPFANLNRRLKAKAIRIIYRLFHALGRPVPQRVGNIEDVNAFAGANYRPKVYPGTFTLFRATTRRPLDGDDEFLGWGDLVAGGIEVHHIPATHLNILQEPGVRILSEKLRECLDRDAAKEPLSAGAGISGR